jgi:hypothetical protein
MMNSLNLMLTLFLRNPLSEILFNFVCSVKLSNIGHLRYLRCLLCSPSLSPVPVPPKHLNSPLQAKSPEEVT